MSRKVSGDYLMIKLFLIIFSLSFVNSETLASSHYDAEFFDDNNLCHAFPDNNLYYPSNLKSLGLTRPEFEKHLRDFERIMSDKVKMNYGRRLIVEGEWDNARVNAFATRDENQNPIIKMTGGMARHPQMDRDSLFLILCHELGHHFGGAPKQMRGNSDLRSWSSAEGQADYYASTKCMPYLLDKLSQRGEVRIPGHKLNEYGQVCRGERCLQIVAAAERVAHLFYDVRPQGRVPEVLSRDQQSVFRTNLGHPTPQCRLDTFISGANCPVPPETMFDDNDPLRAACPSNDKRDGGRPLCWFNTERF